MSKRLADKYITDRNWDEEEEPQEAGVFKQADKSTLERRPIKRAARRITGGESQASGESSTFKAFTGFAGFKKTPETKNAFASLAGNMASFANGSTFGAQKTTSAAASSSSEEKGSSETASDDAVVKNTGVDSAHKDPSGKPNNKSESRYLHQLKSLNESVARWIKQHVDKNPYCILSPIFKDYETYLCDLEKKYPTHNKDAPVDESSHDTSSEEKKETTISPPQSTPSFSFGSSVFSTKASESDGFKFTSSSVSATSSSCPPVFSLSSGFTTTAQTESSKPATTSPPASSIFGSSSSVGSASGFSSFKFGATGSVFGQMASTSGMSRAGEGTSTADAGNADDEEYVPPQLEVKQVKEEDAIYSKRCKLFFKKDDQWKEKGLGHLHLKPCGEKTQLLVRADTNLGNILLNIMLISTMPLTRQGKNNVAIVCVPNPPIDGMKEKEMVPMLIRVKTAEDADELFEKLKELKS